MPPLKRLSRWSVVGLFFVISTLCISLAGGTTLRSGSGSFDVQDVGVNTTVTFQPVYLEGSDDSVPEIVAASRVRIPGWSKLQHFDKFHHTFRVKIEIAPYRSMASDSRVYLCLDQDPRRSLGDCGNGTWRAVEKGGSYTFSMSPFQDKYIDIRVTKSFAVPVVTVSVQDEKSSFRLFFLGLGVFLLVMAPIVSSWVPFYYGTAMTLGVLMVVIVILYQGMKLLPTGRKSTLYIFLYGSLAGLGTVVLRYVSSLVSSVLWEMGLSEDMYSPVAVFVGVGIALLGAWLGYLGVRKLVIAEDGSIDEGVAVFVKWALRVVGCLALLQSSIDPVFMTLALIGGIVISWIILNVRVSVMDVWENIKDLWASEPVGKFTPRHSKKHYMTQAQLNAVKRLPGTEALISSKKGLHSPNTPGTRETRHLKMEGVFLSTFHHSPGYRPPSKQEYSEISQELTDRAVEELIQSEEFDEWRDANRPRLTVEPYERRQERPVEEIELTASLEEETPRSGLYSSRRK
ncbi:unnamed protein product [Calypogeia fissa]